MAESTHTRVYTDTRAHTHTHVGTHTAGRGGREEEGSSTIGRGRRRYGDQWPPALSRGERERERNHDGVESTVRHFGRALSIDRLCGVEVGPMLRALDGAPDLEGWRARERRRFLRILFSSLRADERATSRSWTSGSATRRRRLALACARLKAHRDTRSLLCAFLSLSPSLAFFAPFRCRRRRPRTSRIPSQFLRHAKFSLEKADFLAQNDFSFSSSPFSSCSATSGLGRLQEPREARRTFLRQGRARGRIVWCCWNTRRENERVSRSHGVVRSCANRECYATREPPAGG